MLSAVGSLLFVLSGISCSEGTYTEDGTLKKHRASVSIVANADASDHIQDGRAAKALMRRSHGFIPAMFWGYEVLDAVPTKSQPVTSYIDDPSKSPYNLTKGTELNSYSQWGQDIYLLPLLGKIQRGFFVESGAQDGETNSNTLLYELKGWTGLLVEPNSADCATLKTKHRRAYTFCGCLSPTNETEMLRFSGKDGLGHINPTGTPVIAQPLSVLMKSLQRKTIDFWSLDVEGSEGHILEAFDFQQIEVGVLLVEMNKNPANNARIEAVMKTNGFVQAGKTYYQEGVLNVTLREAGISWSPLDVVFVNPAYLKARGLYY